MSATNTTANVPVHVTPAQIAAARGYLRACVEYVSADPKRSARIEALDAATVFERTVRIWPEGWDHFCEIFASDIRNYTEAEQATSTTSL
ncbi:hypothetical protein [Nocardia mangyaensis]|uniref:hypothetical protein n=1 Tax=Nocardia mangyaensis TaxID=2213200 RepID=UPI002676C9F9|nr:hypothetical protein [Nocardia mangyaensis]MDO3651181.1 hypothetical protein [Nocardia mangyaensis]